jgi:putative ABC transport system permease protein
MYWLRRLFHKDQTERQLASELLFHLEQRTAELLSTGLPPEEARRRARIEFGGMEGVKEECRESRRVHLLETFLQDVRFGLRMLRRNPGFTAVAVLTLALGIGVNTAIFSIVNCVLLNPLPYPQPEQLVGLHESKPNFSYGSISYPNFVDWKRENKSFSAMAVYRKRGYILSEAGESEQVNALLISSDFFDMLAVKPAIGRFLRPGEDEIGSTPVAMIHARLWQRKFAGSPEVIGRPVVLDGKSFTIIGVVPASFSLDQDLGRNDVYVPIGQWNNPLLRQRSAGLGIHGIGRLKPGVSLAAARADMDRLTGNLAAAYPEDNKGIGANLLPLHQEMVGRVKPVLLVLLAAAAFVLLIACVNLANLLLARSAARTREFAVRIALGAARNRLLRQMLTESTLLSLIGGSLGLALAGWTQTVLLRMLPEALPRSGEITLDSHVLIFTTLISVFSGVLFGLAPAIKISRPDVLARARDGSSQNSSPARHRTQSAFVVVEIALALVLLTASGLMIRSLNRLWNVDPGFDSHNVLTFSISLPRALAKAPLATVRSAFRKLNDDIASVPGIEAVSPIWGAFPLLGDDQWLFWIEGQPKPANHNDMSWALNYVVGPDYLKSMRIPLLRGRFLDVHDDEHSRRVLVVDEKFAQKFFPNQDPIGKRIYLDNGENAPVEIVGVVKHVKQWALDNDERLLQAQIYVPFMQLPDDAMASSAGGIGVVVRSKGNADALFESIRNALRRENPEQVVFGALTMDQAIAQSLAARRYASILFGTFALLALTLAGIGIYGVVSYVVSRRTQEIGVRMALGASRATVLVTILAKAAQMTAWGILGGLMASFALTRLLAGLLYGISPRDPVTFIAVALLLGAIALLSCWLPATRATRVDPAVALRWE